MAVLSRLKSAGLSRSRMERINCMRWQMTKSFKLKFTELNLTVTEKCQTSVIHRLGKMKEKKNYSMVRFEPIFAARGAR